MQQNEQRITFKLSATEDRSQWIITMTSEDGSKLSDEAIVGALRDYLEIMEGALDAD